MAVLLGGSACPVAAAHRSPLARELGAQGVVRHDPATGRLRMVARLDGFLTGPSSRRAARVALRYVRSHRTAFALTRRDLGQLRLTREYVDILGTHHLTWQQRVGGVPAFDSGLRASVTRDGRLVAVLGSPAHGLRPPAGARALAARRRGRLVLARGRPAFQITRRGQIVVVDAASGRVVWRTRTVHSATGTAAAWENYPNAPAGGRAQAVTFPVFSGSRLRGDNAHVYTDTKDRIRVPEDRVPASAEVPATSGADWTGYRAVLDTSDASRDCSAAFPCSWDSRRAYDWRRNAAHTAVQVYHFLNVFHDHLYAPPIGFTEAAGNFQARNPPGRGDGGDAVKAQINDGADTAKRLCGMQGLRPRGGFPDHDHAINANMEVTQDGVPPKMQMYLWPGRGRACSDLLLQSGPAPDSNGGDDAAIVYHEYTHGLTNRLVTTPTGVPALNSFQSAAMGEGWSDWYALDFLVAQGLEADGAAEGDALIGRYTSGGPGVRTEGADCPVGSTSAACPGSGKAGRGGYTYADLSTIFIDPESGKPVPEPHADGEIWLQTLWQIRTALGSAAAELLITRALELSPTAPSFLDVRNAIMLADRVAYDGAHTAALWRIFAARGMGFFADSRTGNDFHPHADFHTPPDCPGTRCSLVYGRVVDSVTGRPVAGARVRLAGHDRQPGQRFPIELSDLTSAGGQFAIDDVPVGTYSRLVVTKRGYEVRTRHAMTVTGPAREVRTTLVRDWASRAGGARVVAYRGHDYEQELRCGPRHLIDLNAEHGWLDDGRRSALVIRLPHAVTITSFGIDPTPQCINLGRRAALGAFTIRTRRSRHAPWITALRRDRHLRLHRITTLRPTGGSRRVRFVQLVVRSNRGDRNFIAMAELAVRGR